MGEKIEKDFTSENLIVVMFIILILSGIFTFGFKMGKSTSYEKTELDSFCQYMDYDFGEMIPITNHVRCFNMNETNTIHENYFYRWKLNNE